MAIVPLPLSQGAEARLLLRHLLQQVIVVRRDTAGRMVVQFAIEEWALERLMAFRAGAARRDQSGGGAAPDDAPAPASGLSLAGAPARASGLAPALRARPPRGDGPALPGRRPRGREAAAGDRAQDRET